MARNSAVDGVERGRDDVDAQHHPRPAAVRVVVDLAGRERGRVAVVEDPEVELRSEYRRHRTALAHPREGVGTSVKTSRRTTPNRSRQSDEAGIEKDPAPRRGRPRGRSPRRAAAAAPVSSSSTSLAGPGSDVAHDADAHVRPRRAPRARRGRRRSTSPLGQRRSASRRTASSAPRVDGPVELDRAAARLRPAATSRRAPARRRRGARRRRRSGSGPRSPPRRRTRRRARAAVRPGRRDDVVLGRQSAISRM